MVAGVALLETVAGVLELDEDEMEVLELVVVSGEAGVADAAHSHTALAEACTARPVTGPQPLMTP